MDINIKSAIIHFLANEFKLEPETITKDLQFQDLGLSQAQVQDLLGRMQDALSFDLSEDKASDIVTIEDLFRVIDPDDEIEE